MFYKYTELKPLNKDEASRYRIYMPHFLPALHDNPTTEFTSWDEEFFKNKYREIKEIGATLSKKINPRDISVQNSVVE